MNYAKNNPQCATGSPLDVFIKHRDMLLSQIRKWEKYLALGLWLYGPDDERTLVAKSKLAMNLSKIFGAEDETKKLLCGLLATRERLHGPDDERTLGAKVNLVNFLKKELKSEVLMSRVFIGRQIAVKKRKDMQEAVDKLARVVGKDTADSTLAEYLYGYYIVK